MHSIDDDIELAEADAVMGNNDLDVFERGSGEDEVEFGVAEDIENNEMTSNDMDIDEIGILNEIGISTRLESEFDSPSQFVIENELRSELISLPTSSDTISITKEDNVLRSNHTDS